MYYDPFVHYKQVLQRYEVGTMKGGREMQDGRELLDTVEIRDSREELFRTIAAVFDGQPDLAALADLSVFQLVDYIRRTHVLYMDAKLPEIAQSILSLEGATAEDRRLILLLEASFAVYYRKLDAHIQYEEQFLLPYVEYLGRQVQALDEADPGEAGPEVIDPGEAGPEHAWLKEYSLAKFEQAHTDTEGDLVEICGHIKDFRPSDTDLSPYRILVARLEAFELDLSVHALIEDEVLLPKARKLELQYRLG